MRLSLGPGFSLGDWAWDGLTARPDDCKANSRDVKKLIQIGKKLKKSRIATFAELLYKIYKSKYHDEGHMAMAHCQGGNNSMGYSQVSARDPLFARWHKYMSNFIRELANKILPG